MASYTFFFNKQTFDGRRSSLSTGDDWIDYLTGDAGNRLESQPK